MPWLAARQCRKAQVWPTQGVRDAGLSTATIRRKSHCGVFLHDPSGGLSAAISLAPWTIRSRLVIDVVRLPHNLTLRSNSQPTPTANRANHQRPEQPIQNDRWGDCKDEEHQPL